MTTTSRSARYAKWLSIPLGLAISALLIWQASYAAFSDTETITGNLKTATVNVELGDTEMATFSAENLLPGESVTHEVSATYLGSVDADVSFYAKPIAAGNVLAPELDLKLITSVTEGSFGSPAVKDHPLWEGRLIDFVNGHREGQTPYTGSAEPGDSATLKFIITLRDSAGPEVMGESVEVEFVGSARGKR